MELDIHHRYSRWDGTQKPFDLDESALMDEMADELMAHGDVRRALRELFQRGVDNGDQQAPGLRDLQERLQRRRQEQLSRYNMDSIVDDLKERLEEVLKTEREGIQSRVEEAREQLSKMHPDDAAERAAAMEMLEKRATRSREQLDQLPEGLGGQLKELQEYEFMDSEAERKFKELMDMLRQQRMSNVASDMKDQLQNMSPEEMRALREMMRDLNQMMRDEVSGLGADFGEFMAKWGDMFGDNPPQSFDELMEVLTEQMGQMQSMLKSMSPEQRRELFEAMNSSMDDATAAELAEFSSLLSELVPMEALTNDYPFFGDEDVSLEQAMQIMGDMQDTDRLEEQIEQVMRRGDLDELDGAEIERLLGEDARADFERLEQIAKKLEEAGYLRRKGEKLELTPQGIRKIGMKALKELFTDLKRGRGGDHDLRLRGSGGEHDDETKPYEFGDPFDLHLHKTVMNAVQRNGAGTPVKLTVEDFEVLRTEHTTQAATVLLIDQSRSMGLWGSFAAAKRVALALHALVRSRYVRDHFFMVGFSDYAIEIKEDELPELSWNAWVSGTNIQHGFMVARKLLAPYKDLTKQIIMITDGEPTTYIEGGRTYFSYPPNYKTMVETLKEARRCTQEGITINTFMLETSHYLLDFVDRLTKINKGRALYTSPDNLGEYVMVDYMTNRRRRVSS